MALGSGWDHLPCHSAGERAGLSMEAAAQAASVGGSTIFPEVEAGRAVHPDFAPSADREAASCSAFASARPMRPGVRLCSATALRRQDSAKRATETPTHATVSSGEFPAVGGGPLSGPIPAETGASPSVSHSPDSGLATEIRRAQFQRFRGHPFSCPTLSCEPAYASFWSHWWSDSPWWFSLRRWSDSPWRSSLRRTSSQGKASSRLGPS